MTGSTAPVVVIARTIGPRVTSAVRYRGSAGRRYQRTDAIRPTTMTPEAIAHRRSGRNSSDRPPIGHHLGSYLVAPRVPARPRRLAVVRPVPFPVRRCVASPRAPCQRQDPVVPHRHGEDRSWNELGGYDHPRPVVPGAHVPRAADEGVVLCAVEEVVGGSHSVGALLAEQLAHLRMEVFHAGADGRRLLYLLGGQNGADLESSGEPLAHQGGTSLRFLLHQRIDILRRDGARAEQLVGERPLGRPLLRRSE